jgi:hypothetical protein
MRRPKLKHRTILLGILPLAAILLAVWPIRAYQLQKTVGGDIVRWKESCFYYTLHEEGSEDVDMTDVKEAIRASFDAWENADCTYFYFEETEKNATCSEIGFSQDSGNMNLLVWRESDWEVDADHASGAMALTTLSYDKNTGRILDADVEFNGEYFTWGVTSASNLADIRNTATHEIGHMLGLEHELSNTKATMAPTAKPGDTNKRSLEKDDINGLCDLYPVEEDPDVCVNPYCGLDLSCKTTTCNAGEGIESNTKAATSEPKTGCSISPNMGGDRTGYFDFIRALVLTSLH